MDMNLMQPHYNAHEQSLLLLNHAKNHANQPNHHVTADAILTANDMQNNI